jgi:hypothetical protein
MEQSSDWLIAARELGWSALSPAGGGPNGPMEKLAGFRSIRCFQTSSACDHGTIFISHRIGTIDIMSSDLDHHHVGEMTRRNIFVGAASSLIFAPSIVRIGSLMKVRVLILPIEHPSAGFVERLRFQYLDGALRRGWDEQREGRVVGGISEVQAMEAVACARKNGWLPISRFASNLIKTDSRWDHEGHLLIEKFRCRDFNVSGADWIARTKRPLVNAPTSTFSLVVRDAEVLVSLRQA